jgi:heme exporter protein A
MRMMTASEATSPIFEARALECERGGRRVFAGLDFALAAGGALVLRGANGSGKSSLLRILAGLLSPVGGSLAWNGVSVGENPEAHCARAHYIGHLDALKPSLTVHENLSFWTGLRGSVDGVDAGLDHFGLGDLADLPARYLSAGQRRRANLARLVAGEAELWLLDEPTVMLDDAAVEALARALARHRAAGGVAVVATHGVLAIAQAATLDMSAFNPPPELRP